jgi:ribosomal protein S12 methylthiotransferase accessory factor
VFCHADSNGCASGNTIEEAILQGLMELVERDACAIWWYNRAHRPEIDLDSFAKSEFNRAREHMAAAGRTLKVLDLTHDLGIPVALAVSWRDATGDRIEFGLGAHLDPQIAVSRALCELAQMHAPNAAEIGAPNAKPIDNAVTAWRNEATIENQPYFVPLDGPPRQASDLPDRSSTDLLAEIETCVEILRTQGLEMLVFDHTRADIGFPTVRVTVPSLRHFWARFAPGRLYEVPVALGWWDQPLEESDLNPIPFFL